MIMVMPGAAQTSGLSLGTGSRMTLTSEDADAIRDSIPGVKAVSPVIQTRGQLIYGNLNWAPASIRGEGEDYLEVKDWDVEEGDYFSEEDVRSARKVCVIGRTVQANLFPDESPVGRVVRLKGMPFRVLGVLGPKGNSAGGEDQDDCVILPWTTAKHVLQGSRFNNVDLVLISSEEPEEMVQVERDVTELLRERHRLTDAQPEDFRTLTMVEMIERGTQSAKIMTSLLAAVASISLVVGGVGIMNIMLVSVTERTREIGLRMAVGARQGDILLQFLSEGLLLSLVAGGLGILLGIGASAALARALHWPTHVTMSAVLAAFLSSSAVGLFFGFYPSYRASRLDPIAALRSE